MPASSPAFLPVRYAGEDAGMASLRLALRTDFRAVGRIQRFIMFLPYEPLVRTGTIARRRHGPRRRCRPLPLGRAGNLRLRERLEPAESRPLHGRGAVFTT